MLSVILLFMLMIVLIYSKCDLSSDMWQQASELEFDLSYILNCSRKLLFNFNAGETQHVSFNGLNTWC